MANPAATKVTPATPNRAPLRNPALDGPKAAAYQSYALSPATKRRLDALRETRKTLAELDAVTGGASGGPSTSAPIPMKSLDGNETPSEPHTRRNSLDESANQSGIFGECLRRIRAVGAGSKGQTAGEGARAILAQGGSFGAR